MRGVSHKNDLHPSLAATTKMAAGATSLFIVISAFFNQLMIQSSLCRVLKQHNSTKKLNWQEATSWPINREWQSWILACIAGNTVVLLFETKVQTDEPK